MEPLQELYDLYELMVQQKPSLQDAPSAENEGPNKGNFEHPVTQQRHQIDDLIGAGVDPVSAHQEVHGQVDTSNIESKAQFASTLGRIQDDQLKSGVKLDKNNPNPSILARDTRYEKETDQVTHDDLRTPMNQQVPDIQQTPQDQVAEDVALNREERIAEALDIEEEYDYNEDVAYLQKFGRA